MSTMLAAIRAELTKIVSTRLWWVLLLILVVYVGAVAAGIAFGLGGLQASGQQPAPGQQSIPPEILAPVVYTLATVVGYPFPILLGSLAVTGEFRYQTVTPTFLATPRRGVVLAAKWVVLLVIGALFGVVAFAATVALGSAGLTTFGLETGLGDSGTWAMFGRGVVAMALWGAVGVGLGVLVPSQVGAIVVILAFTQFVEPILRTVAGFVDWVGEVGRFLPGAASDALVGASIFTVLGGGTESLEWWEGGLVLLAYAVILTAIGYAVTWRRDIT